MSGRRREMAALLGVVVALTGCGDAPPSRDLRVTIVDPEGRPIPGAVFYAEARDDSGAFACLVALAGDAGEVPDVAWKAAGLGWRPGARAAIAAFAEGRQPAVHWREDGSVPTDGAVLVLEPAEGPEGLWNPAVARLAWPPPLDGAPPPGDPAGEALRAALAASWRARAALPQPLSPAEQARFEAISGEELPNPAQGGGRNGRS